VKLQTHLFTKTLVQLDYVKGNVRDPLKPGDHITDVNYGGLGLLIGAIDCENVIVLWEKEPTYGIITDENININQFDVSRFTLVKRQPIAVTRPTGGIFYLDSKFPTFEK